MNLQLGFINQPQNAWKNTSAKVFYIAISSYEFTMEFLHDRDSFFHVTY